MIIFIPSLLRQILNDQISKSSFLLDQLVIRAELRHLAVFHDDNEVGLGKEGHPVSDPKPCLASEQTFRADDFVEYVLSHVGVNCAERIVQEVVFTVGDDCSGQADSLFLSAAQVDTLETYFRKMINKGTCR